MVIKLPKNLHPDLCDKEIISAIYSNTINGYMFGIDNYIVMINSSKVQELSKNGEIDYVLSLFKFEQSPLPIYQTELSNIIIAYKQEKQKNPELTEKEILINIRDRILKKIGAK